MDSIYDFTIKKFLASGRELPEDLNRMVKKFEKAIRILGEQNVEIKERFAPMMLKSAAIITIELENEFQRGQDKGTLDKRKRLELEAKALELLQKQYKERT